MNIFWGEIRFLFALGVTGLNFLVRARNINGLKMQFDKPVERIGKLMRKILGNWKLGLEHLAQ